MKYEYPPDKLGWSRVGPHKWRHLGGFIIARYWTLGGKRVDYFSCFLNEDVYYKGINEVSFSSLKEAKDYFTEVCLEWTLSPT